MTTPWITFCTGRDPNFPRGFACLRCGAKELLPKRLPVEVFLTWSRIFHISHEVTANRMKQR